MQGCRPLPAAGYAAWHRASHDAGAESAGTARPRARTEKTGSKLGSPPPPVYVPITVPHVERTRCHGPPHDRWASGHREHVRKEPVRCGAGLARGGCLRGRLEVPPLVDNPQHRTAINTRMRSPPTIAEKDQIQSTFHPPVRDGRAQCWASAQPLAGVWQGHCSDLTAATAGPSRARHEQLGMAQDAQQTGKDVTAHGPGVPGARTAGRGQRDAGSEHDAAQPGPQCRVPGESRPRPHQLRAGRASRLPRDAPLLAQPHLQVACPEALPSAPVRTSGDLQVRLAALSRGAEDTALYSL